MLLLASSPGLDPVQVVLALLGAGGLLSAAIAFFKLRPDVNTAAVSQAQGAADTMAVLQHELLADRDAWRTRALLGEKELAAVRAELEECRRAHGRRRADLSGA